MAAREALLRPEFRDWYPGLVPGIWYRAAWLVAEVLEQRRTGQPTWELDERVLAGAHFFFRGGHEAGQIRERFRYREPRSMSNPAAPTADTSSPDDGPRNPSAFPSASGPD